MHVLTSPDENAASTCRFFLVRIHHGFFDLYNRFSGDVLKSVFCSVFSTILLLLGASALSM
jgi:hypothetical protein